MNRQNQSKALSSFFAQLSTQLLTVAPLVPLVVGGWLVSTPDVAQAQAKPISGNVLIAQKVVDPLPPPPSSLNLAKEQLPSHSFTPRELDFQVPVANPPSINLESYLVYVNDASSLTLQQVRTLEPTAFVRQHNGRSVIQAGVFNKDSNAKQQAKALQAKGIEARIVSLATGEETEFALNSNSYFVVIPASRENLPLIESQVKQLRIDIPAVVSQKEQPTRGPHVRIGPLSERRQAERLNRYMLDSGLKNARVYYGR